MYLFDKKGNKVSIYDMSLDAEVAAQFRQKEIERTDEISCFKFTTSKMDKNLDSVLARMRNQVIDLPVSKLEHERRIFANYHLIKPDTKGEKALEQYYTGAYDDANIIRVHDYDSERLKLSIVKYLLVNKNYHEILCGEGYLDGVISIPETLYFFELLQKGKFEYLSAVDISKLIGLFQFYKDPIDEISLDRLDHLECYGLGTETRERLLGQVRGTQKVIRIARQQGRIK